MAVPFAVGPMVRILFPPAERVRGDRTVDRIECSLSLGQILVSARLDRRACPRLCVFRRRRPADGQRQSQGRHPKACFYEPMVNRTYADLARHYRTAIVPARPYKPRDKAKVEVAVQVVGR
jgi:hypothetical protein